MATAVAMRGLLVSAALLVRVACTLDGTDSWTDDSADIAVGLVQKRIEQPERRHVLSALSYDLGEDCTEEHHADLYRPIKEVLAEHPGVDGNCYFHFYASYLGTPPSYVDDFKNTVAAYSVNAGKGMKVKLHLTNGEVLTTHLDGNWGLYPYDDAMCYMMGWMKGQRLDSHVMKLQNKTAWLDIAEAECRRLPGMLDGPLDENKLTIGYMEDDNNRICLASECLTLPPNPLCTRATLEDYVYHLYPKCLLGDGDRLTGASGQIEWCFARACVTEGNVIKHGDECWPEGLPF